MHRGRLPDRGSPALLDSSQEFQHAFEHQRGCCRFISSPTRVREMMHRSRVDVFFKYCPGFANARSKLLYDMLVPSRVFFAEMDLDGDSRRPRCPSQVPNGKGRPDQHNPTGTRPRGCHLLCTCAAVREADVRRLVGKIRDRPTAAHEYLVKPEFLDLGDGASGIIKNVPVVQIGRTDVMARGSQAIDQLQQPRPEPEGGVEDGDSMN